MEKNYPLFSFDQSILDYEEDEEFYEIYSNEGSEKISELSRQLRSFFNYKTAIIRLRYSNPQEITISPNRKTVLDWEGRLTSLISQYVSNLKSLGINEDSLAEKLLLLLKRMKMRPNNVDLNLLKNLKNLTREIWKIIHILSELGIYDHSQLLKLVLRIINLLCDTQGVFYSIFSEFYSELRENYAQLAREVEGILQVNKKNQNRVKNKKKMVKIEA